MAESVADLCLLLLLLGYSTRCLNATSGNCLAAANQAYMEPQPRSCRICDACTDQVPGTLVGFGQCRGYEIEHAVALQYPNTYVASCSEVSCGVKYGNTEPMTEAIIKPIKDTMLTHLAICLGHHFVSLERGAAVGGTTSSSVPLRCSIALLLVTLL